MGGYSLSYWKCLSCSFCCVSSPPHPPPLENAIVGESLVGAFIKEIQDGVFLLRLDSKEFLADSVVDFPRDEEFDLSPRVQLGCRSGFRRISPPGKAVPNSQGCGMFPSLMLLGIKIKLKSKSSVNLCLWLIRERPEPPT